MKLLDHILNLLFPPKCPFCGKVLDIPGICGACEKDLPWTEGDDSLRRLSGGLRCAAPAVDMRKRHGRVFCALSFKEPPRRRSLWGR